jgi:hypothetical protein
VGQKWVEHRNIKGLIFILPENIEIENEEIKVELPQI